MSEPTPPPLSDDEARRQRQQALRALSHSHSDSPAAIPGGASGEPAPQQRRDERQAPARTARPRPRWLVVLSVVLALVLVASIVLHQLGIFPGATATSHRGATGVVLALSLEELDCLQDAAWSPNGQQVAALGYLDQCPSDAPTNYNYQAGVLAIYSAATGKLVHMILLDSTVLALPGIPAPPANAQPNSADSDTSKLVINYTNMLWSPDGKQLALTFWIGRWNAAVTVEVAAYQGLVLVNADGTNERAALINETSRQYGALRWNTTTMGSLGIAPQQRYGDLVSLPPALSYSWGSGGQLMPQGSLTSASSPTAAVGNPDGGSSFSIWQPGAIAVNPVEGDPSIYTWETSFLAWSPDGHYLVDSFQLEGIVHPVGEPIPTAAGLQAEGDAGAPNVAIRDPALQRLLTSLHASADPEDPSSQINVAWSPNGRVLAAIPDDESANGSALSAPVTLYDCATGKTMGTLLPHGDAANPNTGIAVLLRWSADGSQLLLYSEKLDTITVWGPSLLPKSASA
jgi:hypothetical protein